MKRLSLYIIASLVAFSTQAQTLVWRNKVATAHPMSEISYANKQVTLGGTTYNTADIDSITINRERLISVTYSGNTATVTYPELFQDSITCTINGADVFIENKKIGGEDEFTIMLSGESSNGSLFYDGSYKCTVVLNNLNLTSKTTGAINIDCGKRVELRLADGTTNSLTDAAAGTQKACLYCKGHLEIGGSGTLNITANAKHGIATKEYMQLKRTTGTINILKAASDAIHAGQYFQMNGGTLNIDGNTIADGIQVETITLSDDVTPDASKEANGTITINGGTIKATIAHEDCKIIKCDGDITIAGGTLELNANGNGSRGIQTDGNITISDGTITIFANGARCTLPECASDPHRCMGIKLDGDLNISGGVTTVYNIGSKSRGIKVGGTYTKTGGTVNAVFA